METRTKTRIFLLLSVQFLAVCVAVAQSPNLDVNRQDALDLLKSLARSLKSEPDKLGAARLQARIADELWTFDEPFAREAFRWSFEAVLQPMPDNLPKEKRSEYVNRQASTLKEALRRFGTHDSKQAAEWLKRFEIESVSDGDPAAKSDTSRLDLFMQIAAQLATSDPDKAIVLGRLALSGNRIPEGFGSLLFGLSRNRPNLTDDLFRAAIATLRRNNYAYDPALMILANYLFTNDGQLHSSAHLAEAQLLANYYVDAAWKQAGGDGNPVPPSSASFYTTLELRALPIVSRYAPARLPELRGQMTRIASGLSPQQIQSTELFRSTHQQQSAVSTRNDGTLDEQIERAEKEKNPQLRDALFLSIANGLMRLDSDRALTIAKKIDDEKMRTSAQDDIYLIKMQQLTRSADTVADARKLSLQFSNPVFRAKLLVQLAAQVWSRSKDRAQAVELLGEALTATAKAEDIPDKVLAQLQVVEQFAKFDSIRAFETLGAAMATMNRLKVEKEPVASATAKRPLLTIKNFTVINGVEMTTGNEATIDSIDFSEVRSLATQDYMQARLLGTKLEQPVQRANYLIAVAASVIR
ncbi:MAG TPA: hypothetical protein VHQ94_16670 [Pyrinomonadaceae bacterium]|jgi:hypothetical protein|nr:hypothetical protein [Pyrinomonadaceae bacterium]